MNSRHAFLKHHNQKSNHKPTFRKNRFYTFLKGFRIPFITALVPLKQPHALQTILYNSVQKMFINEFFMIFFRGRAIIKQ